MKYKDEIIGIGKLAFPILSSYAFTTVFEILDEAIIAHYSTEGFALTGIAASIIYSVTGALGILSAAFNITAAKSNGKNDKKEFERLFAAGKLLAILIGFVFAAVGFIFGRTFFENIYGFKGEELRQILSYFYPALITIVQNMILFQYSVYFRNRLNTKTGLCVTLVSTAINLFFDYALVYGKFGLPALGISGAAWGSVIGLSFGLLIYQTEYLRHAGIKHALKTLFEKSELTKNAKKILRLYPSLLGQEFMEDTVFVLMVTFAVSKMGMEQIAVYNLLDIVLGVMVLPSYAYAAAAQTFALQNHSAGKSAAVQRYLKVGIYSGTAAVAALCFCFFLFKETAFGLIIKKKAIINEANNYLLPLFAIALEKVPYQIYLNFFQGIGREKYVFVCTAFGAVITGAFVILLGKFMGLTGVYIAMFAEYFIIRHIYAKKSTTQTERS